MLNKIKKCLSIGLLCASIITQATPYWNWNTIDTNNIQFPQNFLWGTTHLAYEIEGNATNNTWHSHELVGKTDGKSFTQERSGIACDHWSRYVEDIQLMSQSGLNSCCLSLDWSKIEPMPGVFDEKALQHYADECNEYNRNGIM